MKIFSSQIKKEISLKNLWGAFFTNLILWILVVIYTDGASIPLGAALLSTISISYLIYPEKKHKKK